MENYDVLVLGKDNEVIAIYDPSVRAVAREDGTKMREIDTEYTYQHTREQMNSARKEGKMTLSMYHDALRYIHQARDRYLASQTDYDEGEIDLQIGLGDTINDPCDQEFTFGVVEEMRESALPELNLARNIRKLDKAIRMQKSQRRKLDKLVATRLN